MGGENFDRGNLWCEPGVYFKLANTSFHETVVRFIRINQMIRL